jgi:hypothetical protein
MVEEQVRQGDWHCWHTLPTEMVLPMQVTTHCPDGEYRE